jgi:hypothetical protein
VRRLCLKFHQPCKKNHNDTTDCIHHLQSLIDIAGAQPNSSPSSSEVMVDIVYQETVEMRQRQRVLIYSMGLALLRLAL